ncbi:MAG: lipid-A-disaccharide synthase [Syntrophales bacterium]|jgi:lipid-A-disaccharide synthase|nr:lipid-A-disaccharide synthase [Syntrophales bacterium]MDY0044521.1 lipid-A-disaccharide synthase [Syntrophales bacterium]
MIAGCGKNLQGAERILIIAGEASGDLHGANLVREMKAVRSDLLFFGIGGERMAQEGVCLIAHISRMAVVGFTEVISKLGFILHIRREIKKLLKNSRPDLVILIDYPDFNMPLAKFSKKIGIPVFYYIGPQVWAWRKKRVFFLEKYVDRMAVILPFEEDVYTETRLDVHFVGHPLLDLVKMSCSKEEAFERFGLRPEMVTIALLPGSREKEVTKLLPAMLKAAELIKKKIPDSQFILPLADPIPLDMAKGILLGSKIEIAVVQKNTYDALGISDIAMVASGTATLETAVLEIPMIIIYKVSPFSYILGRIFVDIEHIGLVNIIAGRKVVPEFIQGEAQPGNMATEVFNIIDDSSKRDEIKAGLREVRHKMGQPGAAARAAAIACELI